MKKDKYKNKKKIKKSGKPNSMPFIFSCGIICGPHRGSFAVQFGDRFRSGDHFRPGIIFGVVQRMSEVSE